jgi:hypothetical protein
MVDALKPVVLRVATLNLSYFAIEFFFAHRYNSVALFSDSLDFLEDASVNLLIFLAFSLSAICLRFFFSFQPLAFSGMPYRSYQHQRRQKASVCRWLV